MNRDLFNIEEKQSRRNFLTKTSMGLGAMALGSIVGGGQLLAQQLQSPASSEVVPSPLSFPNFFPKAKRIVYLFMSGGPSQMDLFDYKPELRAVHGQNLPDSVRKGQRLTGMSAGQTALPMAASAFEFQRHGKSGAWVSELLPHTAKVVDDLCFIKTMYTEAINHDPAITFFQSGNQIAGRPSIGAWVSYGLGSLNENLPTFIVLVSKNAGGQPLYARLWGNGFLPTRHQGVQFRSGKDPVLYLNNPEGYDGMDRRAMLNYLKKLNQFQRDAYNDPEVDNRIAQYEMAYRMQTAVPEVTDLSNEPDYIFERYGPDSRDPGTFATAALITDLKERGLLEDTLVIWGGEFGRTVYSQGKLTGESYGRDHHPRCFTMWMAGAGVKAGMTYGRTDDFGYNILENPVHVHDFQATLMHLMGINHEQLTFKYQGRRFRLTDVHGHVVHDILS